jgi:hypothetical protein
MKVSKRRHLSMKEESCVRVNWRKIKHGGLDSCDLEICKKIREGHVIKLEKQTEILELWAFNLTQ